MNQLPTVNEIAMIAATLAKSSDDDNHALARRSVNLWLAAYLEVREFAKAQQISAQQAEAQAAAEMAPVSWDEGLRRLLTHHTETDATRIMREYCGVLKQGTIAVNAEWRNNYPTLGQLEVLQPEEILSRLRKNGWKDGLSFNWFSDRFQEWHKSKISTAKSEAAKARWGTKKTKSKRKNPIDMDTQH